MAIRDLPDLLEVQFFACLEFVDGEYQVKDEQGLIRFVLENVCEYPELLSLIELNEDALNEHYRDLVKFLMAYN
jgi:hypothetical protein